MHTDHISVQSVPQLPHKNHVPKTKLKFIIIIIFYVVFVENLTLLSACRSRRKEHQETGGGMVLPFEPMTMTFKDLHYFVPIPKVSPAAFSAATCFVHPPTMPQRSQSATLPC